MPRRTREQVFAWAAAQTAAGRRPSYRDMADYASRDGDFVTKSTIATWVHRHGDPRQPAEADPSLSKRGTQTPEHPTEHPCAPPHHTDHLDPTPPASSGVRTPNSSTTLHFAALSPKQERAVFLKATGETHTEIARQLGIERHTVGDWLHLPAFAAALSELRTEAHIASREALLAGAQLAIHGTIETMQVMLAVVRADAVALSPNDRALLEAGEQISPIIDPRLQIQAARVFNQQARTLMDRAGFHARAELHLSGGGDGEGEAVGLHLLGTGELEDDLEELEDELTQARSDLRLLEDGA